MAATRSDAKGSNNDDRAIEITRLIQAPRALVYKAWTTPQHLGNWFGPRGFTTTTYEFSLKPGGVWRFVMHGPDGTDYRNLIRFVEVVPNERLAYYQNGGEDTDSALFQVTVTFAEERGKTRLTLRMVFDSPQTRDLMESKFGAIEGGEQTVARLADYLPLLDAGEFVLTRAFEAPRDMVWRAWTQAEHLARWWGPKGCRVEVRSLDLRPGGVFHYVMHFADGNSLWGRFAFREINAPELLVYLNAFSDEQAGATRNPWDATWPMETLSRIEFVEHDGRTTVTIRWWPWNASEAERATFAAGFESMFGGWSGSLDQLEEHLKTTRGRR